MKLHHLTRQLRSSCFSIIFILAVAGILIGVTLVLHIWREISIEILLRDPAAITGQPFYTGFLSQMGIFFWSAAATVCLFSVLIISRQTGQSRLRQFLLISGMLTLFLGLDDAFLLHEEVFPIHLGISEKVVFGSYAGFMLFYLSRFYPLILRTEYILMMMALFFFSLSMIVDKFDPSTMGFFLLEDSAKLIGILSWLAYFFRIGQSLVDLLHESTRAECQFCINQTTK